MSSLLPRDLEQLLDRQNQAWLAGGRPSVEDLLTDSALRDNPETLLDLLYNEIVRREDLGERPSLEEYARRYPHLGDELRKLFEVHAALEPECLDDTRPVPVGESIPAAELPELRLGPSLPDYDIVTPLGQGGMGIVYQARHRRLQRLVALKMFQPGCVPSSRELLRFQTEAEAIARLQHPNIVQVFEVGQANGLPYLALELVEAGTLAHKLQKVTFTPRAAAELIATLARAVQHAHEQQIVHRDIKPANVLFTRDGTPKITDFGLAKVLEESPESPRDVTGAGEPIGTPRYMAPEQASGRPDRVGPATDVYALGTVLFECLTGQVPFVAPSSLATMAKIREEEPPSPRRLQRQVPRDLETICLKCLHKQPERRYASAQALADDLHRYLHSEPIHARPTPAWERLAKWARRRPATAALMAASVVAACAGLIGLGVYQHLERQRIDGLRGDVDEWKSQGQQALDRKEAKMAEDFFLKALTAVRAEPALRSEELNIAGWLDHSRRLANPERWQQRPLPPPLDELRDEALVQCVLPEPSRANFSAARQAIHAALGLTVADEPSDRPDRALLLILDVDLLRRAGKPAAALAVLQQAGQTESRLCEQRRAACLDELGRPAEAKEASRRAEALPPEEALELLLAGIDCTRRGDPAGAIDQFDRLLLLQPNHFMGRWLQAACMLRQRRLGEAKVALVACLGQRPHFPWTCLLLAQVHARQGDTAGAMGDYERGLAMVPRASARAALLTGRGFLRLRLAQPGPAHGDFDQVLTLAPESPDARVGRGLAVVLSGDYRAAVADAEQAGAIDQPDLLVQRARLYAHATLRASSDGAAKRQYEAAAIADLRRAIARVPAAERREYWDREIVPDTALRSLGELPDFHKLDHDIQNKNRNP